MTHDRAKPSLLDEETVRPFLTAIGVMTADGRIRANQQRKFRQINEFLRLIDETGEIDALRLSPSQPTTTSTTSRVCPLR